MPFSNPATGATINVAVNPTEVFTGTPSPLSGWAMPGPPNFVTIGSVTVPTRAFNRLLKLQLVTRIAITGASPARVSVAWYQPGLPVVAVGPLVAVDVEVSGESRGVLVPSATIAVAAGDPAATYNCMVSALAGGLTLDTSAPAANNLVEATASPA